jgi:hypothetical protein
MLSDPDFPDVTNVPDVLETGGTNSKLTPESQSRFSKRHHVSLISTSKLSSTAPILPDSVRPVDGILPRVPVRDNLSDSISLVSTA